MIRGAPKGSSCYARFAGQPPPVPWHASRTLPLPPLPTTLAAGAATIATVVSAATARRVAFCDTRFTSLR
jgi:hypothetical protein